jgi:FkbM family methyltransferase
VAVRLEDAIIVLDGAGTVSRSIFLMEGRELEDERNFRRLVRQGMTVFDVGANLGVYTLLAAARVGPEGRVHAFEPVPQLFQLLTESVRRSGSRNILPSDLAVSDRSGSAVMYLGDDRDSDIHALAQSERRTGSVEVRTITIDDYVEQKSVGRVDLIKIDVEGAELPALRGARRLLAREDAPLIQAEVSDENARAFGYAPPALKEYLAGFGYHGFRSRGGEWQAVPIAEPHPKWENVLFVRSSHSSLLPPEWDIRLPA